VIFAIDNVYKNHRLGVIRETTTMSRSHQPTARWHSIRGPLANRQARLRIGLETIIFLLAVGFTIALVFGLFR
jgi:hypothetical protein